MSVKVKIELRCKRDLEVPSEIHFDAVLIVPGQEEKVFRAETLADENQLACLLAELEDTIRETSGVTGVGAFNVTGLDDWEWERKTPRQLPGAPDSRYPASE